jgi:WD40 repeat protein
MITIGTDDASQVASTTRIQVFEYNDKLRKWSNIHSIVGIVHEPVHDIAFAPNLGRTHHVLAVASCTVDIIHMVPSGTDSNGHTKLEIRNPAQLDHQGLQVWRVEWNITGTTLATSADDGQVRLFKANYQDTWERISIFRGDGSACVPSPVGSSAQPGGSSSQSSLALGLGGSMMGGALFKDKSWYVLPNDDQSDG